MANNNADEGPIHTREFSKSRPVFDQIVRRYPSSSIAAVGCNTSGCAYSVCEIDLLVTATASPPIRIALGSEILDIHFIGENPSMADLPLIIRASMSLSHIIADPTMMFSSYRTNAKENYELYLHQYSREEAREAITQICRSEDAQQADNPDSADFWIFSAVYHLSDSLTLRANTIPSPSHMLAQLRSIGNASGTQLCLATLDTGHSTPTAVQRRMKALQLITEQLPNTGSVDSLNKFIPALSFAADPLFNQHESSRVAYLCRNHQVSSAYLLAGRLLCRLVVSAYECNCINGDYSPLYHHMIEELLKENHPNFRIARNLLQLMGIRSGLARESENMSNLKFLAKKLLS